MDVKILPHTPYASDSDAVLGTIRAADCRRDRAQASNFLFTRALEALHMANFLELKRVAEISGRVAASAADGEELLGRIETLLRDQSQLLLDQDVLMAQRDLIHAELQYARRLSSRDRESRDGGDYTLARLGRNAAVEVIPSMRTETDEPSHKGGSAH